MEVNPNPQTPILLDIKEYYPLRPNLAAAYEAKHTALKNRLTLQGYEPGSYIISANPSENVIYKTFKYDHLFFHIRWDYVSKFLSDFRPFIQDDKFIYDNLINLLIMVKNAGPDFKKVLKANLPFIDRWTFLDTGSTDETVEIIKSVLAGKEGTLYQEPFINFRESRNRLFELAAQSPLGNCVYNVVLDDTYVLNNGTTGKLRDFLFVLRTDSQVQSFSLYIKENDLVYSSNRISRPEAGLKYVYRVHEILQLNRNFLIPEKFGFISSQNSRYMSERTDARKAQDLQFLLEDYKETPDDRLAYYIAETYLYMKNFPEARKWYEIRKNGNGYDEEAYDAMYKCAVLDQFNLGCSWDVVEQGYLECYERNPNRPEPLVMIGFHYKTEKKYNTAFLYLKKAWEIGSPEGKGYNMNLKVEMYNIHLPRALIDTAMILAEYSLADQVARFMVEKRNPAGQFYLEILTLFGQEKQLRDEGKISPEKIRVDARPTIAFVAKGGWGPWGGSTLYEKGLGGSETTMIKYAEELAKTHRVVFFSPLEKPETVNKVEYYPIDFYVEAALKYVFDYAVINRYPEYIPFSGRAGIKCYFLQHDLFREGEVILDDPNFLGLLAPTHWCAEYSKRTFPELASKIKTFSYGVGRIVPPPTPIIEEEKGVVNLSQFLQLDRKFEVDFSQKKKHSFIYPSFPNRGLSSLLSMWDRILNKYPDATLDIFCDFDNSWLKANFGDSIQTLKLALERYPSIKNHGWVSKTELEKFWIQSSVWLYPCIFLETACLTCMEALFYKNLVICPALAGLAETGAAGELIPILGPERQEYTPDTRWWQDAAIEKLFFYLDHPKEMERKVEEGWKAVLEKSYSKVVENFRNEYLK